MTQSVVNIVTRRVFGQVIAAMMVSAALTDDDSLAASVKPGPGARGLAFVMNSDDASVSLIDMQEMRELQRMPVLREPHHWTLSPDGKQLLVGDATGNAMFFFDPQSGALLDRRPISDPYQFWLSPDGRHLTVASLRLNHVDIYDGTSLELVKRFSVSTMPSHLAYTPDSRMVYVSVQDTGELIAIDLSKLDVIWRVKVGPAPAGVMWHQGKILVGDMGADYVVVVDPASGRVERRIQTGAGAHALFVDPAGERIYIGNRVAGTMSVLDARNLNLERAYNIPGGPDCLSFAPDGRIWMTLRFAKKVAVLEPMTGQYTTIAVGRSPHGLFLNNSPTLQKRDGGMLNAA